MADVFRSRVCSSPWCHGIKLEDISLMITVYGLALAQKIYTEIETCDLP